MPIDRRLLSWFCAGAVAALLPCGASAAPSASYRSAHETAARASRQGYQFLSPVPGARYVTPQTTLTIRRGDPIDPASLAGARIRVSGETSGEHPGTLRLASDGRTLVFGPDRPFQPGEQVHVALGRGLRTRDGGELPPIEWGFSVSSVADPSTLAPSIGGLSAEIAAAREGAGHSRTPASPQSAGPGLNTFPLAYVPVNLVLRDDPLPGSLFLAPFSSLNAADGRLLIVDDLAQPLFYRAWPGTVVDFKRQPDGTMTFFAPDEYVVMDSTGLVLDRFTMGNGYVTDLHEFQVLSNGHVLMMAYDPQPVRMDSVVVGGDSSAIVVGLIIQEQDAAHNVVFQWRSWDHFEITDMIPCTGNLLAQNIDYVHGNAIEPDLDGNILISSRHMNEITRIDRQTGDVLWRLGLNAVNNDFAFPNDTRGFSHQHDIRRLPNGHITLFDNGNCMDPLYSRLVEYDLDEINWEATLVQEYRHTPDIYGGFMGNQQVHQDGSITASWGGAFGTTKLSDLHADGTPALEMGFGSSTTWTYRAFRFPWQTTEFSFTESLLDFGSVTAGDSAQLTLNVTNELATDLTLDEAFCTDPRFSVVSALPLVIGAGGSAMVDVAFAPDTLGPLGGRLYLRTLSDSVLVARGVDVTGTGIGQLVAIEDVTQNEGNVGTTIFEFTVRLATPALQQVQLNYATEDGTATVADSDYLSISGSLTIPVGDSTGIIQVDVLGDTQIESDEDFGVRISDATNAYITRDLAVGTILNEDGATAVGDRPGVGLELALREPMPNPARGSVRLACELPSSGRVALEVFDLRGRRVATLIDREMPAGRASVTWEAAGRPVGVYFVRLRAGDRSVSRRIALVR